jgi:Protein of unknown function (DUF4446)
MLSRDMIIIIGLGALVAVGLVVVILLYMRIRRTENECALLLTGNQGKNFVEIVNDNIDRVEALNVEVEELSESYGAVLRRMAGAMQHVGVVRFDAFRDLGGLLSFAVAMLDDRGNGIVISSIYGRSESRTYTKPIVERNSSYELSPEEREAIRLAMQSKEMGALPIEARDREHYEKIATLKLFHEKDFEPVQEPEPEMPPPPRRPEKPERLEKPERVERAEKPERVERLEKPERVQRTEKPVRPERPEPSLAPPPRMKGRHPQPRKQPERPEPQSARGRPAPSSAEVSKPPPRKRRDAKTEAAPPDERTEEQARRRLARQIRLESEERAQAEAKPPEVPEPANKPAPTGHGLDSPVDRLRRREPEE